MFHRKTECVHIFSETPCSNRRYDGVPLRRTSAMLLYVHGDHKDYYGIGSTGRPPRVSHSFSKEFHGPSMGALHDVCTHTNTYTHTHTHTHACTHALTHAPPPHTHTHTTTTTPPTPTPHTHPHTLGNSDYRQGKPESGAGDKRRRDLNPAEQSVVQSVLTHVTMHAEHGHQQSRQRRPDAPVQYVPC